MAGVLISCMTERIEADGVPSFEELGLPISQAIVINQTVYVAGQTGIKPDSNELVDGGVVAETRQTMENIGTILDAAGTSLNNLVKVTIFMRNMDDYNTVNTVYSEFVSEPYPARSAVEVSNLAGDFAVEIEAIATM